jgi:hypothetical protein
MFIVEVLPNSILEKWEKKDYKMHLSSQENKTITGQAQSPGQAFEAQ